MPRQDGLGSAGRTAWSGANSGTVPGRHADNLAGTGPPAGRFGGDPDSIHPAFTFVPLSFTLIARTRTRNMLDMSQTPTQDLRDFLGPNRFGCVLADPPWRFQNRTGKVAPEHKRLSRYPTLTLDEICALPVADHMNDRAHCYLWVPNALLPWGLTVLSAWGFAYKSNLIWHKERKDGGSDGRGVGFYFRNVTEVLLFGTRGRDVRTLAPGRRQVNFLSTRKREHSRKPDEQYEVIEGCSWGPYLELFGRGTRPGWSVWGNQADADWKPDWKTYAYNSGLAAE